MYPLLINSASQVPALVGIDGIATQVRAQLNHQEVEVDELSVNGEGATMETQYSNSDGKHNECQLRANSTQVTL